MIVNYVIFGSYHPKTKSIDENYEIKDPCFNLTLSLVKIVLNFFDFFRTTWPQFQTPSTLLSKTSRK